MLFEKASRLKIRFKSYKGLCTTEDLWDLPMTELDSIAKELNSRIREESEGSFINKKATVSETLEVKFEVIKKVIAGRLSDIKERRKSEDNKIKKDKILTILSDREDDAITEKSTKELKKMIKNL